MSDREAKKTGIRLVREITGRYTARRHAVAGLGHAIFLALPWLHWHGKPMLSFDLAAGAACVAGHAFVSPWPALAWLLALVLGMALILVAGTVVGRLWCGYACPHTAYAALYLWIERRIEGRHSVRVRRAAAPLAWRNLVAKAFKHGVWLAVALLSGFALAAYFTPAPALLHALLAGRAGAGAIAPLTAYAATAYVNAGLQRPFLCNYLCPLAPLQQAVLRRGTVVVAYDGARGEPRGLRNARRDGARLGDCLDCTLCVQVCPTGDDIRAGLRGGCLGCGACIDACDRVMDKRGLRRGLIRYVSLAAVIDANNLNRSSQS